MQRSIAALLCSALLFVAAACNGHNNNPAPAPSTPANPVSNPVSTRASHDITLHGDHDAAHKDWSTAQDKDQIYFRLDQSSKSFWVCMDRKVCSNQAMEFQVTPQNNPVECTLDGSQLGAGYDVAEKRKECGKGHSKGPTHTVAHCGGCTIP